MNYLIIGGSSYSGKCTIQAIRELDGDARIITTTSGSGQVPGADYTIPGIDLGVAGAAEAVAAGLRAADGGRLPQLKALVYIPARGEVGLPARYATKEQVEAAVAYSIAPMLRMMRSLDPELTVCYSGFITMEPLLQCYGAMSFIKIAMEEFVVRHRDRMRIIRFGMFPSNSVRGIGLLVQRNTMRKMYPEFEVLHDEWKASGKKFLDFFYDKNYVSEEKTYSYVSSKPFRPTGEQDIVEGVKVSLETDSPIINVLGNWIWTDDAMPELPPIFTEKRDIMPTDAELDRYLAD